ncbi:MAG: PAS and ANTAR domain-containing protein [Mycobacterium sp.]
MFDETQELDQPVAQSSGFTADSEPSTNGAPVRRIDKALLGGAPQSVGRFEYHYRTDTWTWSDTVARIHGYEPGEVQPTTELVLSHKHPDDLAQVKGLLQQAAAPFSSRHRIRTKSGDERNVVVVGNAVTDDDGQIVATRGFYIDITESVNSEVQDAVSKELEEILAHRETIEQAKGMLMAVYSLSADAAFGILRWRSQECNVKLWTVAAQLVRDLPGLLTVPSTPRAPVDHYLLTLVKPDGD